MSHHVLDLEGLNDHPRGWGVERVVGHQEAALQSNPRETQPAIVLDDELGRRHPIRPKKSKLGTFVRRSSSRTSSTAAVG